MAEAKKKRKVFDNRYEILSIVGRGSCSVVYHARHLEGKQQEVALKVLIPRKDKLPTSDMLRKEALAMVSSRHKYVIRLDDFHSVGDLCYLSMEFAPEGDLRKYIDSFGGKLSAAQAELFLLQAAEGLDFIHKAGILHRDIKPDNFLIIDEQNLRLGDFGVAVLPGEVSSIEELQRGIGTMSYMSPEMLEATGYDKRSDIYSLGVAFYEAVSGTHPFDQAPLVEQIDARKDENVTPLSSIVPDIPPHLEAAIHRAMKFNAEDRFESCRDLIQALLEVKKDDTPPSTQKEAAKEQVAQVKPQKETTKTEEAPEISTPQEVNEQIEHTEPSNQDSAIEKKRKKRRRSRRKKKQKAEQSVDEESIAPSLEQMAKKIDKEKGTPTPHTESIAKSIAESSHKERKGDRQDKGTVNTEAHRGTQRGEQPPKTGADLAKQMQEMVEAETKAPQTSKQKSTQESQKQDIPPTPPEEETKPVKTTSPSEAPSKAPAPKAESQSPLGLFQDSQKKASMSMQPPPSGATQRSAAHSQPPPNKFPPLRLAAAILCAMVLLYITPSFFEDGDVQEVTAPESSPLTTDISNLSENAFTIPAVTNQPLTFPHLPSGVYSGSLSNSALGENVPLVIVSFRERQQLVFFLGIVGWDPQIVSIADKKARQSLHVASNGFIFDFSGEEKDGVIEGLYRDAITGEEAAWMVTPQRATS